MVLKKLENMFGFLFDQPVHKSIRQLRLPTLILVGVCIDIMYRLTAILEASPEVSVGAAGALGAVVLGAVWQGIKNLTEVQKDDD